MLVLLMWEHNIPWLFPTVPHRQSAVAGTSGRTLDGDTDIK